MGKIRISGDMLNKLISESIKRVLSEERLDKDGDGFDPDAKKGGQGWGRDTEFQNRQGYNADGSKGPWFSRSVACVTCVLLKDSTDGGLYVLAGERGEGTPDYQGYWNLPCGYLDYNEETVDAACREVYEETGIKIDKGRMRFMWQSSSPFENRQNVCCVYATVLNGRKEDYGFSKDNMEENEVGGINWVPINEIKNYKWAFGHGQIINKILSKFGLENSGGGYNNADSYIKKAIQMLYRGENTEEVIDILKMALEKEKR